MTLPDITLRAPEPSDLDMLYRLENDPRVREGSDCAMPVSRHLLRRYIDCAETDIGATRQLRLMITDTASGQSVGTADLFDYDPLNRRAAVGIAVDSHFLRRGYALAALGSLGRFAARHLGLRMLHATVAGDNAASLSLFAGARFEKCAELPDWFARPDGTYCPAVIMVKRL